MTTVLEPTNVMKPAGSVGGESIFHKMRNIINSIHVSTGVIHQHLRDFHLEDFGRVADMLEAHSPNLSWYLSQDPKGKKIPRFINRLSQGLVQKHQSTINELVTLQNHLEQLEFLLAADHTPNRTSGVKDIAKFSSIVDEVIGHHQPELDRLGVQVVRDYHPVEDGILEVHKLLPILTNVVRTAINAMRDLKGRCHRLTLHILSCPDRDGFVRIQVEDTGCGIPPEFLTQVVSLPSPNLGYRTSLPNLYASAMAARGLGGSLRVWSEGEQQGTSLTLDMPVIHMEENR